MERIRWLLLASLLAIAACASLKPIEGAEQTVEVTLDDSLEYELIVLDPKYESFLITRPPAEHYSQGYYESWNRRYVTEWNIRHSNSLGYGDFYQTSIDYDPSVDYGLELNYRLYNYFLFIEQEYGIRLIQRR